MSLFFIFSVIKNVENELKSQIKLAKASNSTFVDELIVIMISVISMPLLDTTLYLTYIKPVKSLCDVFVLSLFRDIKC